MRAWLRIAVLLAHCLVARGLHGQVTVEEEPKGRQADAVIINPEGLWNHEVFVAGLGSEVPGIDLSVGRRMRHRIGDSAQYALRAYVDTAWPSVSSTEDSIFPGATVHWVRYHLAASDAVKGWPLLLNVHVKGGFTLFLNGEQQVQAKGMPGNIPWNPDDSVPRYSLPVTLLCDGKDEILALRLETAPGAPLSATGLRASIHAAGSGYHFNGIVMNHGVFIGINVIILLMALVMGWSEGKRRVWFLLAAMSLVSVLDTVCALGGEMGAFGWPAIITRIVELSRFLTVPWGMYLLIMVLAELRGEPRGKRSRLYASGIVVITLASLVLMAIVIGTRLGGLTTEDFVLNSRNMIRYAVFAVLAMAGLLALAWFAIEEVRLGIKLWRTKGYERWVGAGAVAASLLTLLLGIISGVSGLALSSRVSVIANYCSFVAVPVSVAIYLSIRSAHHTRLVTRQRDELDLEVQERTAELRSEKERSDELLHNILPHEVAEELKRTGAAEAKHFDQATVLFSDFRGFTQLSEKLSPEELVREIDTCFKHFDGLMDKWGMEKIKTIGDSYMAAGGLPDPSKGSPADVVQAALEMQEFMEELSRQRTAQGLAMFRMRVGIHTGPVVAGIVGVKKFQYDIWGDTVNTASRMESAGEVGEVNISEATYRLLVVSSQLLGQAPTTDDQQLTTNNVQRATPTFTFIPRGKIQVKGKGEMEMFFVRRSPGGA